MATSKQTLSFQRVQVATPGTSVALAPQPYDNTETVIIYNRGSNTIRLGIGAAGGAVAIASGTDIPSGASLALPIGTLTNRPGPAFSGTNSLILDADGGAGDAQVTFMNVTGSK